MFAQNKIEEFFLTGQVQSLKRVQFLYSLEDKAKILHSLITTLPICFASQR
jgi:hypothetical protein